MQRLTPCKGQQALHQRPCPLGRLGGAGDQPLLARTAQPLLLQQVERADDRGEQIVEVMRHAPGQLAHRLHLLRLAERVHRLDELRVTTQPLGDVGDELEHTVWRPCSSNSG